MTAEALGALPLPWEGLLAGNVTPAAGENGPDVVGT